MQTLVAEYTVDLKEGIPQDDFRREARDVIDLIKGINRWNLLELPDGRLALEIHLHGQTERSVAARVGEQVHKTLVRFDMADIEYHGIDLPEEIQLAKDKWQGREPLESVIKDFQGTTYIRLDYYARGLSFDDLGISDANAEMLFVKAFQTWQNRSVARECIRRVRDHFERLGELSALGKLETLPGRTSKVASTMLKKKDEDSGNAEESSVQTPAAATA